MIILTIIFFIIYLASTAAERYITVRTTRISALVVCALVWISILMIRSDTLAPWQRLALSCVGLLWLLKLTVLAARQEGVRPLCRPLNEMILRFAWPGMSDKPFATRRPATMKEVSIFTSSYIVMLCGIASALILALVSPNLNDQTVGILGLFPLFMMIHLGYSGVLTGGLRALGYPVEKLFDRPECSESLRDFWGKRWNRPFVDMNRALIFKGAFAKTSPRLAIFMTFLVSGLLHELGISLPASAGWGWPLLYFAVHGTLVLLESSQVLHFKSWPTALKRLWVWSAILLPLPLLLHDAFRSALIVPLYRNIASVLLSYTVTEYFSLLVPIAGIAHCLPLLAGSQLPIKLDWKSDLAKLKPFNRKIMWNYGAFIFLLIVAFGSLTLRFQGEMVRGEPAALGIAALIFGFWSLRILVDLFYFSHDDWPEGPEFVIGHALLNSAFLFLVLVYGGLLVMN